MQSSNIFERFTLNTGKMAVTTVIVCLVLFTASLAVHLNAKRQVATGNVFNIFKHQAKDLGNFVESKLSVRQKYVPSLETLLNNYAKLSPTPLDCLKKMGNTILLQPYENLALLDANGNYLDSEGQQLAADKITTNLIPENENDIQITHMPFQDNDEVSALFTHKLKTPVTIASTEIHYLILAVNAKAVLDNLPMQVLILTSEGNKLYQSAKNQELFVCGRNAVSSLKTKAKVIGGCSFDDLPPIIGMNGDTVLELSFPDKRKILCAYCSFKEIDGGIMLMVPSNEFIEDVKLMEYHSPAISIISALLLIIASFAVTVHLVCIIFNKQMRELEAENSRKLQIESQIAQEATEAKTNFLSQMSHDIRTPLNGIIGMTDIARKNIANSVKTMDCLSKITTSSQYLLELINNKLDITRMDNGTLTLDIVPTNICKILEQCSEDMDSQIHIKKIQSSYDISGIQHPDILADKERLRQIIINLMYNAITNTSQGGTINFIAKETQCNDNKVTFLLEIDDNGFNFGNTTTNTKAAGNTKAAFRNNSDLTICKKFVEMMNGEIIIEDNNNIGTKITVELTFNMDMNTIAAQPQENNDEVKLEGLHVLVVDDNDLNLEIAVDILEEQGAIVTQAQNGSVAVEKFSSNPPGTFDVILMDMMMPVMNGLEATREIRKLHRKDATTIPIIAMTANTFEEDVQKTREAGMNAHLGKPVNVQLMLKTLNNFRKNAENFGGGIPRIN